MPLGMHGGRSECLFCPNRNVAQTSGHIIIGGQIFYLSCLSFSQILSLLLSSFCLGQTRFNMRTTFNYISPILLTLFPPALAGRPRDEISFSCLPLTIEMSDPIMFPGNESDHLHLVAGGTAFQRTMAEDTARKAIGTTCGVEIDKSNYWVPELYHQTEGGFELVGVEGIVCIVTIWC